MKNSIQKFNPKDENLLLSEMEMLEIYGGTGSDGDDNGCNNDGNEFLASCKDTTENTYCGNANCVAGCACPSSGSGSGSGCGCGCGCGSSGN